VLAACIAVAGLAACGDDDDDTASAEYCGPMEELASYNAESPDIDVDAPWDELRAELVQLGQEAERLYGDALAVAPDEITEDLQRLSDYSTETLAEAADASSYEEFSAEVVAASGDDIIEATDNVGSFLREHCGFGLSRSG
jgi:hypothetical protein